eukprot:4978516-Prymnesium_polylepis.1
MPGQKVGARRTEQEQIGRDRTKQRWRHEFGRGGQGPAKGQAGCGQVANASGGGSRGRVPRHLGP